MTLAARVMLRSTVMLAEGCRLKPYRDTAGKLTIGFGRNLDDVGISKLEAEVLLDHDLAAAEIDCRKAFVWFDALSDARQTVIVEMAFNLGLTKLLTFRRMLAAVRDGDYVAAAAEMIDSQWASQVNGRAVRLAAVMRG